MGNSWKKGLKGIGLTTLSASFIFGTASVPIKAETNQYTQVAIPDMDGKIPTGLLPQGANKDELVDVVIQFTGDPVLKTYSDAKKQGIKLDKNSQVDQGNKLKSEKKNAEAFIVKNGGKVFGSYEKVYNGLFAQVKRSSLPELASYSEVQSIHDVHPVELNNATSVPFIGAPNVWKQQVNGVNVTGKGIRVAVIDTGIDYTHKDFGGPGTVAAYKGNNPNVVEPGSFPTAKVVGGYDFVGTNYDAASTDPSKHVPHPDNDPLDEAGHGSHVAGTIAGFGVDGKIGKGVAPDALLYAYKVFGATGSTGVTTQALEMAMDPNGDGDVSDHVDVVNMSLGSSYGNPDDPEAAASDLAVDAGIIVVASAGNSGNVPYITGSPGVSNKTISVAASVDDGIVVGGIKVNSPSSVAGTYEAVEGAITKPVSVTGPITGDLASVGIGCSNVPDLTGKIALIDRGTCSFTQKLANAKAAHAIAAVVVNNAPGDAITMGGTNVDLPGFMISQANGTKIKAATGPVNVTLSNDIKVAKPWLADTIADFSSRGPGIQNGFKPEVSAPGFDIESVGMGSGDGSARMNGTSMASPHVAGVAALLRQLHPDWSTDEIKSLIMNTSKTMKDLNGQAYPLSRQGAGRVQADVAAKATTTVSPQAFALGYVPVSDSVVRVKHEEVTVTNKGTSDKEYDVQWTNRDGAQSGAVSVSLPKKVKVNAGKDQTLKLDFSIDATKLADGAGFHEVDGYIVLTDKNGSGDVVKIPYQAVVEKVSDVQAKAKSNRLNLENRSDIKSTTDLFLLGDVDQNEADVNDYFDLKTVGARVESDAVEFAVGTNAAWNTPNLVEFDVYIDSNMDGNPDYILFNQDLGNYLGGKDATPTGQQVSVLYNLKTGKLSAQYYINVGGTWNNNVMGLPVDKSVFGSNQIQYFVASFGGDSAAVDQNNGWIPLNVSQPTFESDHFNIDPHSSVDVQLSREFGDVMVVDNSDATQSQVSVVSIRSSK